ncbi:MAG: 3-isopropylmalate dehydratase small subunit [Armatimonadetes bacterium]|nr:3-isopropylmalate dehydratase small subunit [Armatimonadota bacterium]
MSGFTTHTGKIAVLNEDQVDTDRIIPARFLSKVEKSGYGELLFNDVRKDGFILDTPDAKGASILVVGTNFGCGSSREHAVWAIQQGGFQCVIARKDPASPGFSDIFRGNAANCGLLLIELSPEDHQVIASQPTGSEATVDLPDQTVTVDGKVLKFDINEATKLALVEGLDLIGTTLRYQADIDAFEAQSKTYVPKPLETSHV